MPLPAQLLFCCADTEPQPWLQGLRAALPGVEVSLWQPGAAPAEYAVVWAPPQQFFDEQTRLKAVFNIGAGVDALLRLKLNPALQIIRLNDAGMAVQMAEYVCLALLRHFREGGAYAQQASQGQWLARPPLRHEDFPVGILGMGVLGERVARAVAQFDFPVRGWSRSRKVMHGVQSYAGPAELPAFLAASRVLVCLLPLTPETENILNLAHLSQLQTGGYLINVARGRHLVEEDLLELLDSGHLAGATLDVFKTEPLPPEHPFWQHPKIEITPHISARTLREESIRQIASKLHTLCTGGAVPGQVNRGTGY